MCGLICVDVLNPVTLSFIVVMPMVTIVFSMLFPSVGHTNWQVWSLKVSFHLHCDTETHNALQHAKKNERKMTSLLKITQCPLKIALVVTECTLEAGLLKCPYFILLLNVVHNMVFFFLTGVITSYGLWLDGVLKVNSSSSERFFVVEELSPWSRHILRLQACTAQGCGKGPMVS